MRSPDHTSPATCTPSPRSTGLEGSTTTSRVNTIMKLDQRSPLMMQALRDQSVSRLQGHHSLLSSTLSEPSQPAVGAYRQHTDHLDAKLLDDLAKKSTKLSSLGKKTSDLELFGVHLETASMDRTPPSNASSIASTSGESRITELSPTGKILRSSALRRIEERKRVAMARTGPLRDKAPCKRSTPRATSPVVAARTDPKDLTPRFFDLFRPRITGRAGPCSHDISVSSTPPLDASSSGTLFPSDSDNSDTDLEFIEPNLRIFTDPSPGSPPEMLARFAVSNSSPKNPRNAIPSPSPQQLVIAHDKPVSQLRKVSDTGTMADYTPMTSDISSEVKVVVAATAENVSTISTTETCNIESAPISVAMEEQWYGFSMRAFGGVITQDIFSEDAVPSNPPVTKVDVSTTQDTQKFQTLRMSPIITVIYTAPFTELKAPIVSPTLTASPTTATTDDSAALLLIFCFTTISAFMVALDDFTSDYSTKLLTNMGFAMFLALTMCIALRIHTGTLKKEDIKHIPKDIARWVGRELGGLHRAVREGFEEV